MTSSVDSVRRKKVLSLDNRSGLASTIFVRVIRRFPTVVQKLIAGSWSDGLFADRETDGRCISL